MKLRTRFLLLCFFALAFAPGEAAADPARATPEARRDNRLFRAPALLAQPVLGEASEGAVEAPSDVLEGGQREEAPRGGGDRLDRFRQLAGSRLAPLELRGPDPSGDGLQEIYALLDEELLENLNSGPLFASTEFLQERLDALSEVWGGSAFRVVTLAGTGLTVGAFQLSSGGHGNSVRIYARNGSRFDLVQAVHRPGVPVLFELPRARSGAAQFFLAWVGPQSNRGSFALRVDLWKQEGGTFGAAWSTATLFPDELLATKFDVHGQRVTIRYEVRYPGWKPGCEGQTELEDLYQYAPDRDGVTLARRRTINGWHRELHAGAVSGLLRALAGPDRRALAQLVPAPAVRARLPDGLLPDLACDVPGDPAPSDARVAAVAAADRRVWDLRFRRLPDGWRLVDAAPAE